MANNEVNFTSGITELSDEILESVVGGAASSSNPQNTTPVDKVNKMVDNFFTDLGKRNEHCKKAPYNSPIWRGLDS